MKKLFSFVLLCAALAGALAIPARAVDPVWNYAVQVSAQVQASPAKVTLSWPQDTATTPSSYVVYRKAPGASTWGSGVTLPGTTTTYVDTDITVGTTYEYQIVKNAGTVTGHGYILAGINVPFTENRGKLLLLVDNSHTTALATELTRLQQDLVGDGWTVIRHDVSRTASPATIKGLIKTAYAADPANVKAVFLFGRIPVPYSGNIYPDGHADHQGAWPSDVYYGDMDGAWTDTTVNVTQTKNTNTADAARLTNIPGDGKFDQSTLPSAVELMVGRVDLSNLPGKTSWNSPASFASEVELLRQYLNKDHNYRQRKFTVQRRAIIGDYFGSRSGEAFAASAYRAAGPLVGSDKVRNLNVEYNDQKGVWVPALAQADYLFAAGFGAGSYRSVAGLGNSGTYNDGTTVEMVSNEVKGVFTILFGSWLGDWDNEDNILRSVLATKTMGLTAVWSGRPHWFFHPIGLGEPIGAAARLTQNNNGLYQNQRNNSAYGIHVALMGDPTLRLHPVAPAASVTGSVSGTNAALSWQASADTVVGYHVYRGSSVHGPFTRLTSSPVSGTSFTDTATVSGAVYMVRAIKLETSPSGTYFNGAQGAFWSATTGSTSTSTSTSTSSDTTAPTITLTAPLNGVTLRGIVPLTVNASDNVGVASVQYQINSANFGSPVTVAPFASSWNTTTVANGWYAVRAIARDAAGNTTISNQASVKVDNSLTGSTTTTTTTTTTPPTPTTTDTTAPKITLTTPVNGEYLTATVKLSVTTSDNVRVAGVQYQINGTNFGPELTAAPFNAGWNTAAVPNGWYSVTAIARDSAGNKTTSNKSSVKVANSISGTGTLGGSYVAPDSGTTTTTTTTTSTPSIGSNDTVWFHDALPAGATGSGSGGDAWTWISSGPTPFTGSKAHQSNIASGVHEHSFNWASATLTVAASDRLFVYVYLDPANPPREIMLSWKSDNWEHRAYWGENLIGYGKDGTNSRRRIGDLPAAGGWVRLELPASVVGLEGHTISGMSFCLYGGRATWDATGKAR